MVRPTLGDQLRAFAATGDAELLGDHAIRRALCVAERVPIRLFPWGFEVRLAADSRVDFGGAVTRAESADLLDVLVHRPLLESHPAWQSISCFARAWRQEGGPLGQYVPFIGFEFDLPDDPPTIPVPSVFVLLDWPVDDGTATPARSAEGAAQAAVALLCGTLLASPISARLASCFRHLGADSRILSVGAMVGRTGGVRVFVSVPRECFADYLRRCEWPGDVSAVARVVHRFAQHFAGDMVQVQMDVGATLGERLGVEWSYLHVPDAARRWKTLTDDLVTTRLVTPQKRNRLLAWSGVSAPSGVPFVFRRDISHLKLVIDRERPVEAKAYVSVTLVP